MLDWIQHQKNLKPFVAHRVSRITQHTKPNQWNYIPTELNPADHGTRGFETLRHSLQMDKRTRFPFEACKILASRMPANLDRSICTATVVVSQTGLVDISRFSSWNRLLKTTAIVRFFIRRLRDPSSAPTLTANDFQLATETLLRQLQLVSFPAVLPRVFQDSSYQLTQKSWKETQKLVNHIWKRLLTEYIPTLHHRSKWNQQLPLITVELVWVLRDFTPRGIWPIGRVEAVFPVRDGQTRVCSVKTAYGTFEGPAVSLSRVFAP